MHSRNSLASRPPSLIQVNASTWVRAAARSCHKSFNFMTVRPLSRSSPVSLRALPSSQAAGSHPFSCLLPPHRQHGALLLTHQRRRAAVLGPCFHKLAALGGEVGAAVSLLNG